MKLDVNVLRYLSKDEFRVLTAVEMGMKNHEIVPTELIERIAGLKHGGAFKNVKTLLRHKLVHHDSSKYDGYRLTTLGYDFLAIKTMANRGLIVGVGRQIGVGKESDIFEVVTEDGETLALKLHRLGRTSFRAVKSKRDYLKHRSSFNWLYLSRLAALKEYAFMKALGENGFPVPKAVDWNRHCVLMSLVPGYPLVQIKELQNPVKVFDTVIGLIVRLAEHGLIHCDFNEFNIMIDDNEDVTMIDFPQMVSVSHQNAEMYFDRDVECILKIFNKRFTGNNNAAVVTELSFEDRPDFQSVANMAGSLDRQLEASGFTRQDQMDLEKYTHGEKEEGVNDEDGASEGTEDEDDCSEESDNEADTSKETNCDNSSQNESSILNAEDINNVSSQLINSGLDGQPDIQPEDSLVTGEQHSKGLEKRRKQAASAVRSGVRTYKSRNTTKDKGGRRSRHVSNKMDF